MTILQMTQKLQHLHLESIRNVKMFHLEMSVLILFLHAPFLPSALKIQEV